MSLCRRIKYNTEAKALNAAKKLIKIFGKTMHEYYCYSCCGWHLTTMSKEKYEKRLNKMLLKKYKNAR